MPVCAWTGGSTPANRFKFNKCLGLHTLSAGSPPSILCHADGRIHAALAPWEPTAQIGVVESRQSGLWSGSWNPRDRDERTICKPPRWARIRCRHQWAPQKPQMYKFLARIDFYESVRLVLESPSRVGKSRLRNNRGLPPQRLVAFPRQIWRGHNSKAPAVDGHKSAFWGSH